MNLYAKNGFTLIEAMLAVVIVSLILAPIFVLEDTIFSAVGRTAQQFQQLMFAKNFLYKTRLDQKPTVTNITVEKREENPVTILKYSLGPVPADSSVKNIKHLYREFVEAKVPEKNGLSTPLLTFQFKP
jgi:prepilin-type N-terminal cleavage/methylation domain-containing protein